MPLSSPTCKPQESIAREILWRDYKSFQSSGSLILCGVACWEHCMQPACAGPEPKSGWRRWRSSGGERHTTLHLGCIKHTVICQWWVLLKGEGGREEALARHASKDTNISFHVLQMFTSLFITRAKEERVLVLSMWMANVKKFSLRFQVLEKLLLGSLFTFLSPKTALSAALPSCPLGFYCEVCVLPDHAFRDNLQDSHVCGCLLDFTLLFKLWDSVSTTCGHPSFGHRTGSQRQYVQIHLNPPPLPTQTKEERLFLVGIF